MEKCKNCNSMERKVNCSCGLNGCMRCCMKHISIKTRFGNQKVWTSVERFYRLVCPSCKAYCNL